MATLATRDSDGILATEVRRLPVVQPHATRGVRSPSRFRRASEILKPPIGVFL
jgi:hypothetical protein